MRDAPQRRKCYTTHFPICHIRRSHTDCVRSCHHETSMRSPTLNVHVVQLIAARIVRAMSDKGRTFSADEQMRKFFDECNRDNMVIHVDKRLAFLYKDHSDGCSKDNKTTK